MGLAIDIGIGVIILIAAIFGVIRGFHNQFTKGFCNFVALCAAIALTVLVSPIVRNAEFYQGLQLAATGWFNAEYFSIPITSVETLNNTLAETPIKILTGVSNQIFAAMQQSQADTLGRFFGNAVVNVIFAFIIWLAFYLAIKFILFGFRALMTKTATLPVLKSIDKIFGVIWAELLTYLIVVVFALTSFEIIVCSFVQGWIEPVKGFISSSKLLSLAHNLNLGSVLARFIGIDLTVLSPV